MDQLVIITWLAVIYGTGKNTIYKLLEILEIQYLDRGDPKSWAFLPSLFDLGFSKFLLLLFFLFAFWAPHPCSLCATRERDVV